MTQQACGAKTQTGRPCQQLAMRGQRRCYLHGGKSPQALTAAAARLAEQRARRALADLGTSEPVRDPFAALEHIAGQAVTLTDLLRGVVADLEELRYRGGPASGTESIRGELTAYLSALARAESVLGRIISLNLDQRRLQLDEARAAVVVAALAQVLGHRDLALDEARQRRARELLAAALGATVPSPSLELEPVTVAAVEDGQWMS